MEKGPGDRPFFIGKEHEQGAWSRSMRQEHGAGERWTLRGVRARFEPQGTFQDLGSRFGSITRLVNCEIENLYCSMSDIPRIRPAPCPIMCVLPHHTTLVRGSGDYYVCALRAPAGP